MTRKRKAHRAVSLLVWPMLLAPAIAAAQTYTNPYGYVPAGSLNASTGYDPMNSAASVMMGQQTLQSATEQNTTAARRALSDVEQQATQDAIQGGVQSVTSTGLGVTSTGEQVYQPLTPAQAASVASTVPAGRAGMTDAEKAQDDLVNNALAHAMGFASNAKKKSAASQPGGKAGKTEPGSPAPSGSKAATTGTSAIVKGFARALDTITLSVGGRTVVLDGIEGPGNGESCSRNGATWPCGEEGREQTQRAIAGVHIACNVSSANMGVCMDGQGRDIATLVVQRGIAHVKPSKEYVFR